MERTEGNSETDREITRNKGRERERERVRKGKMGKMEGTSLQYTFRH